MPSRGLNINLFDGSASIHLRIRSLLQHGNIDGMSQQQLESAYEEVINALDAFTNAIQKADSHFYNLQTADAMMEMLSIRAAGSSPVRFTQKKWNPSLINKYLQSLQQLRTHECKLRYTKDGKVLFALPDFEQQDSPGIDRKNVLSRVLWLLDQKHESKATSPARGHERYCEGPRYDRTADQLIHPPEEKRWMLGPVDKRHLCLPLEIT